MFIEMLALCALIYFGAQGFLFLVLLSIYYGLTRPVPTLEERRLEFFGSETGKLPTLKKYNVCIRCGWNCNYNDIMALNTYRYVFEPCPKCQGTLAPYYGYRKSDGTIHIHR